MQSAHDRPNHDEEAAIDHEQHSIVAVQLILFRIYYEPGLEFH